MAERNGDSIRVSLDEEAMKARAARGDGDSLLAAEGPVFDIDDAELEIEIAEKQIRDIVAERLESVTRSPAQKVIGSSRHQMPAKKRLSRCLS